MGVALKQPGALNAISLTPLIDVVFLLLIFFLVASEFEEEENELKVELPEASQSMPLRHVPQDVVVNIDEQGQFVMEGVIRTPQEVENILVQASANNPVTQKVLIRPDKRGPAGSIITVFDICHKIGIQYTIATDESE